LKDGDYTAVFNPPLSSPPPPGSDEMVLTKTSTVGNLHFATKDASGDAIEPDFSDDVLWRLVIGSPSGINLEKDEIEDFYLLIGYEWSDV